MPMIYTFKSPFLGIILQIYLKFKAVSKQTVFLDLNTFYFKAIFDIYLKMNTKENDKYVCSPKLAPSLDNFIRKLLHNPIKIFSKYIHDGMTIIDLGCGPGFFTAAFAAMCGNSGRVIAADLQEKMLEIVKRKIKGKNFENRVSFHLCGKENTGIDVKADFINTFYMVHEVPSAHKLINEVYTILNQKGIFFITEPKIHVSKKDFCETVNLAENEGFKLIDRPNIHFSRSAVFVKE
jgi:SAM-dependent methyltransferase